MPKRATASSKAESFPLFDDGQAPNNAGNNSNAVPYEKLSGLGAGEQATLMKLLQKSGLLAQKPSSRKYQSVGPHQNPIDLGDHAREGLVPKHLIARI